jgi:hypothetical protein
MRFTIALALVSLVALPLLSACNTLRSGWGVAAGHRAEADAGPKEAGTGPPGSEASGEPSEERLVGTEEQSIEEGSSAEENETEASQGKPADDVDESDSISMEPLEPMQPTEGWASKYIPGWKKLSGILPPPTDARRKWDQWQKRGHSGREDHDF